MTGGNPAAWGMRPELTPDEVCQLPDEWHDVDPTCVRYGLRLLDLIAQELPFRSWLEAATRGGYVPHADGIELALRGLFLFNRARAGDAVERDLLGDAAGWLGFGRVYRQLAELLLSEAASLDAWRRELGLEDDT